MAVSQKSFPVVLTANNNSYSSVYGRYFAFPHRPKTLDLRGLIERVAFDQSVYSREIIEGVIQRLTKVMVEQLQSGQPIRWDSLGTFMPQIETAHVVDEQTHQTIVEAPTLQELLEGNYDLNQLIAGVHIRFTPMGEKNEDLTSRALRDLCSFVLDGYGSQDNIQDPEAWRNGKLTPRVAAYTVGGESHQVGDEIVVSTAEQTVSVPMTLVYKGTYGLALVNALTGVVTQVIDSTVKDADGQSTATLEGSITATQSEQVIALIKGSDAKGKVLAAIGTIRLQA